MVSQFEICPELHTDEYGDSGMTTLPTVDWAVPRQSQVLGSDSLLPGETLTVRAEAREFADDTLRPIAHELNTAPERRDGFRRDIFQAIADAGLFAVPFAQDVGGRENGPPRLAHDSVRWRMGRWGAAEGHWRSLPPDASLPALNRRKSK